jgi:hypothetical protein
MLALALIELEGEGVDLALQLTQAVGQAVSLLAERLGQRHHRLDEPVLAVLGGEGRVAHRCVSSTRPRAGASAMPDDTTRGTRTCRAGVLSA